MSKIEKCKKPRRCCECNGWILEGEEFNIIKERRKSFCSVYRTCMECYELGKELKQKIGKDIKTCTLEKYCIIYDNEQEINGLEESFHSRFKKNKLKRLKLVQVKTEVEKQEDTWSYREDKSFPKL